MSKFEGNQSSARTELVTLIGQIFRSMEIGKFSLVADAVNCGKFVIFHWIWIGWKFESFVTSFLCESWNSVNVLFQMVKVWIIW